MERACNVEEDGGRWVGSVVAAIGGEQQFSPDEGTSRRVERSGQRRKRHSLLVFYKPNGGEMAPSGRVKESVLVKW